MEDRVPNSIIYRKDKKGFEAPDSWMKEKKIQELINESINKLKSEGIVKTSISLNNWKYIMANKLFK